MERRGKERGMEGRDEEGSNRGDMRKDPTGE
jgi:hypothetical protein